MRACKAFLVMVCSMAMHDQIVIMDESAVSFHTPKPSSRASSGWKGPACPHQGQSAGQQEQEDGLGLPQPKGLIYINHVPRGIRVNANYILDSLGKFMKVFKQKRMMIGTGGSIETPSQCTLPLQVTDWLVTRQIQVIQTLLPSFTGSRPSQLLLVPQGE